MTLLSVTPEKATIEYNLTEQNLVVVTSPITLEAPRLPVTNDSSLAVSCSCVAFAQQYGAVRGVGLARNHPINTQAPQMGAIVVTRESSGEANTGHLAIVTDITKTGIYVKESNYVRCRITYNRFIAFSSGLIRGYYLI